MDAEPQQLRRFPPGVIPGRAQQLELDAEVPDEDAERDPIAESDAESAPESVPERQSSRAELLAARKAKQDARKSSRTPKSSKSKSKKPADNEAPPRDVDRAPAELPRKPPPAYAEGVSAVPPDDVFADMRTVPTLTQPDLDDDEPEEARSYPELTTKKKFACLADINAEYEIGTIHHLVVERLEPKDFMQVRIKGLLGQVHYPLSDEEFAQIFGGGKYSLRVYGPHPRGLVDRMTGVVRVHAFTDPIIYEVPGIPVVDIDLSSISRPGAKEKMDPVMNRRPTNGPEATVLTSLLHSTEKQSTRADELNEKRLAETRQRSEETTEHVKRLSERMVAQAEKNLEDERRRWEQSEAELRRRLDAAEARNANSQHEAARPAQAMIDGVREVYTTNMNHAQAEIKRAYDDHRDAIRRLEDEHKRTLEQLREAHRDVLRQREQKEDDLRKQGEERVRELRDEKDRREREIRAELEDRHRSVVADYEAKLALERSRVGEGREMEKELQGIRLSAAQMGWDSTKLMLEQRISQLETENKRLTRQLEEKSDLRSEIGKAEALAESLGFSRTAGSGDEPRDWKERIAASASSAIENLPEMIGNVREALQARNAGVELALHMQQQQRAPQPTNVQQIRPPQQPQLRPPPAPTVIQAAPTGGYEGRPFSIQGGAGQQVGVPDEKQPPSPVSLVPPPSAGRGPEAEEDEGDDDGDGQPDGGSDELPEDEAAQMARVKGHPLGGLMDEVIKQLEYQYVNQVEIAAVVTEVYRRFDPFMVAGLADRVRAQDFIERLEVLYPDSDLLSMEGQAFITNVSHAFRLQGQALQQAAQQAAS